MPRETHHIFTNEGATSAVTFTLPLPFPVGQVYHFINVTGTELKINSLFGEILYGGLLISNLTSYIAGATLTLVSKGNIWLTLHHNNLWRPDALPPLHQSLGAFMKVGATYSSEFSHIAGKPTNSLVIPPNEFVCTPIQIAIPGRFAVQLGFQVTTAEAGNSVNLAIYTSNSSLKPQKRIAISGNLALSSTGWIYSDNLDVTFPYPGIYFLAHNSNSNGTARVKGWSYPFALTLTTERSDTNPQYTYRKSQNFTNPLPDPAPQDGFFASGDAILISLKVVSWL